jgi:hypothetical protein
MMDLVDIYPSILCERGRPENQPVVLGLAIEKKPVRFAIAIRLKAFLAQLEIRAACFGPATEIL